jgi:hypothetical protein
MQATLAKLFDTKQEPGEPTPQVEVRFSKQVVAVESVWGPLIPTRGLKLNKNQQPTAAEMKSRNKFLACLFLANSDQFRHKSVIDDLANDHQLGKNSYPEDVPCMLQLLINRRSIRQGKAKQIEDIQDGVSVTSFHQTRYPKNNNELASGKAKEYGLKSPPKADSDSDESGPSGWFSKKKKPKQVTSFQYEQSAWFKGDEDDD